MNTYTNVQELGTSNFECFKTAAWTDNTPITAKLYLSMGVAVFGFQANEVLRHASLLEMDSQLEIRINVASLFKKITCEMFTKKDLKKKKLILKNISKWQLDKWAWQLIFYILIDSGYIYVYIYLEIHLALPIRTIGYAICTNIFFVPVSQFIVFISYQLLMKSVAPIL